MGYSGIQRNVYNILRCSGISRDIALYMYRCIARYSDKGGISGKYTSGGAQTEGR